MAESNQKGKNGYKLNCIEFPSTQEDNANAALIPIEASMKELKDGRWFTNNNHGQPGVISKVKMSKTGKHGHAKFTFNVSYPFTGQNSQEMHPGHTHLTKPECAKSEYQVTDYNPEDGTVDCMDASGDVLSFFMDAKYDGSGGGPTGADFQKLWDEVYDQPEPQDLWIQVLKAPVKKSKNPVWICQITGANYKKADG